jgi:hypothetical protein
VLVTVSLGRVLFEHFDLPFAVTCYQCRILPIRNVECDEFFVVKFIISAASKFVTNLLAAKRLIIRESLKFDIEWKSSIFLLEIMILVSSAYNIGSDTEFILRRRSFVYRVSQEERT